MKNIRLIAILLGNIGCTLGWIIDKSCSSGRCSNDDTHATKSLTYPDTYFPIVTEALLSATQRASSAALFIDVDPVNPEVQQLYDYFFIPEGKDRVLCPAVLKNIEQFNGPSEDKTNPKEVIIYCDLSRYVERKEEEDGKVVVKMYDPDIDEVETKANLVAGGCGTAVSGTATAFTVTQRKAQKIQQIQICPWFMNYVASVQYQVVRTNTLKGWIYRALNLRPTLHTQGTPEARPTLVEMRRTVSHPTSGSPQRPTDKSAGWKNCVGLKENGGFNNAGESLRPSTLSLSLYESNIASLTDSIAFFGLTLEVWKQGGVMPQLDGSIRASDGPTNEKRSRMFGKVWEA
ncbi:MAG: hypothetical protein LQ352_002204 [Teloschistes flavicans]|nr:MAG: hypothetical protein LQ352_002204 [Teloschistes flavicans]